MRKRSAPESTRAPFRRPGAAQVIRPATSAARIVRRAGRTTPCALTVARRGASRTVSTRTAAGNSSPSRAEGSGPRAVSSANAPAAIARIGRKRSRRVMARSGPGHLRAPVPLRRRLRSARSPHRARGRGSPGLSSRRRTPERCADSAVSAARAASSAEPRVARPLRRSASVRRSARRLASRASAARASTSPSARSAASPASTSW